MVRCVWGKGEFAAGYGIQQRYFGKELAVFETMRPIYFSAKLWDNGTMSDTPQETQALLTRLTADRKNGRFQPGYFVG